MPLTAVSAFAGVGGIDLALERSGIRTTAAIEVDPRARGVLRRHFPNTALFGDIREVSGEQLLSTGFNPAAGVLAGVGRVRDSPSPDSGEDSTTTDPACSTSWHVSPPSCGPSGCSSKTCLVCCPPTRARTWDECSKSWSASGTAWPGGWLTHKGSALPSDGDVSCLSDVLETGPVPAKYYLSAKAAAGILRRAERRGRKLPPPLLAALRTVAGDTGSPRPPPTWPAHWQPTKAATAVTSTGLVPTSPGRLASSRTPSPRRGTTRARTAPAAAHLSSHIRSPFAAVRAAPR